MKTKTTLGFIPLHWDFKTYNDIYHDIGISRPKNHNIDVPKTKNRGIEIRGLKHNGIEKRRQLSHETLILGHFFKGQKATTLGFQDLKATTSRFQGQKFLRNSDPYAPNKKP